MHAMVLHTRAHTHTWHTCGLQAFAIKCVDKARLAKEEMSALQVGMKGQTDQNDTQTMHISLTTPHWQSFVRRNRTKWKSWDNAITLA